MLESWKEDRRRIKHESGDEEIDKVEENEDESEHKSPSVKRRYMLRELHLIVCSRQKKEVKKKGVDNEMPFQGTFSYHTLKINFVRGWSDVYKYSGRNGW